MNDSRIGTTLGPYILDAFLGRGATGEVYLATQKALNRRVAVKLLSPALADEPGFVDRFRREAVLAANLKHPHIVTVHDFGEDGKQLFLVTEYIAGGSLKDSRSGPVEASSAADLVARIAGALDYAHSRNILHRDVKPSNILLERPDYPKLGEFGIGVGTPEYMSPEQADGAQPIDGRSDIYSLGIVLFELLTGEVPFLGDSPEAVRRLQREQPLPVAKLLRHGVSPEFVQILMKATAKRADQRYGRAGEMQAAIENLLARQPRQAAAGFATTTASIPEIDALATTPVPPSDAATVAAPEPDERTALETNPVEPGPPTETGLAALALEGGMSTGLRAASFIGSRIAQIIVIYLVVITALFVFTRVVKDPIEALGGSVDAATAGRIRDEFHLNDPLPAQYARFVGSSLLGDYGRSLRANRPASEVVDAAWPATRTLGAVSLLVALLLGIPFAALAAFLRRGVASWLPRYVALALQSLPGMVVGIVLIYLLAIKSRALPAFGSGDIEHLVMPVTVLTLVYLPAVMRAGVAFGDSLRGELGHSRRVLRAIGSALSILIFELGAFVGALLIVENLFNWPGVGRLMVTATQTRDVPVVTAAVLDIAGILAWLVVLGGLPRALADFRASAVALFADGYRALGAPAEESPSRGARILSLLPVAALLGIVLLLVLGSFAPPVDPFRANIADTLKEPGGSHLLGTDRLGRDIFSRVLVATRSGVLFALGVVLLAGIGGGIFGGLAGFLARRGAGWIAAPIVWLASTAGAFPLVVWLIAALGATGPGLFPNLLLFATWLWPLFFALFAGLVIDRTPGRTAGRVLGIAVAGFAFAAGSVVINEGYLGFLGLSLPPPSPTLGGIVSDGRQVVESAFWPQYAGLFLAFLAFSFNVLGDTLAGVLRIRRPF